MLHCCAPAVRPGYTVPLLHSEILAAQRNTSGTARYQRHSEISAAERDTSGTLQLAPGELDVDINASRQLLKHLEGVSDVLCSVCCERGGLKATRTLQQLVNDRL